MASDSGTSGAQAWTEAVAANMRAYRARRKLGQEQVAAEMKALGFTSWRRQTVASVENCQRRITADEIIGLARVLQTFPAHLLALD